MDEIFRDLRSALHEHTDRLRQLAAVKLFSAKDGLLPERRSSPIHGKGTEKSGLEGPK